MYNNENVSKNDDYKNCGWYKGNLISFWFEIKNYQYFGRGCECNVVFSLL